LADCPTQDIYVAVVRVAVDGVGKAILSSVRIAEECRIAPARRRVVNEFGDQSQRPNCFGADPGQTEKNVEALGLSFLGGQQDLAEVIGVDVAKLHSVPVGH